MIWKESWSCGWCWVFSWLCSLTFCLFCIFVGNRCNNDHKRASVGRVIGSKIKILEAEMDKILRLKLVV